VNCTTKTDDAAAGGAIGLANGDVATPALIEDCYFDGCSSTSGGAISCVAGSPGTTFDAWIDGCVFRNNISSYEGDEGPDGRPMGGGAVLLIGGYYKITHSTFYGNMAQWGGGVYSASQAVAWIETSIMTAGAGDAVRCFNSGSLEAMSCCDLWGNDGDWVGCAAAFDPEVYPAYLNISLDPSFFNPEMGDFRLREDSPCLPSGDCAEGMGATTEIASGVLEPQLHAESPRLWHASPNPFSERVHIRFSAGAQQSDGTTFAEISDAAGRVVTRILDLSDSGGTRDIVWDGADENGRPLPGGIYFLRVHGLGMNGVCRVVLVR
jgi:hypothetical protein